MSDDLGIRSIGASIRSRRLARSLTLEKLADLVGCTKSYLSGIENERRGNPPSEGLLRKLEETLGFEEGELVEVAMWRVTPASVRREVEKLHSQAAASRNFFEALYHAVRRDDSDVPRASEKNESQGASIGKEVAMLDELYRSGELQRLIDQMAPPERTDIGAMRSASSTPEGSRGIRKGPHGGVSSLSAMLPVEIPLINSVAAGYPTEFTDMGYPARVADEYIRAPDIHDSDAFAARVVGDSMMPEYREGDIVVFSPARAVKPGMDCFARLEPDQESTFKRVYFEPGASDAASMNIRLQPLNPAYPAQVLPRERVAGLYAAVSVMRML